MERFKRVFVVVMDSLGVGAMPDSADFGDIGVNTLGHISESVDTFEIPNLQKTGNGKYYSVKASCTDGSPAGLLRQAAGEEPRKRYHDRTLGNDGTGSTKSHFMTFTETGFPPELIQELEERTGHKVIGNKSASGTEILDELAEEEIATGHMIVYTSADSVLQICGNEETFGLDELYRCCEIARELTMKDEWRVGRVIARPYVGKKKGEFKRTSNRHDYALKPTGTNRAECIERCRP